MLASIYAPNNKCCSLLPISFTISLFEYIRQKLHIKGISVAEQEYKVSLFTNNLVIYITDPIASV